MLTAQIIAQTPNPDLANIPENTWIKLHENGIHFYGHTAYSGGAYDRKNHQFILFGGGHWDGWQNDIMALDITSGTWKSMYTPTPQSAYNCGNVSSSKPGMLLNEQMPASRHTWDQMEYMDHIGKVLVYSGATYSAIWSCPGQTMPKDTWLYDYATNTWEYKNVARAPQPGGEAGAGAYDPVSGLYYAYMKDAQYRWQMWFYNSVTDKWTLLPGFGPAAQTSTLLIDRKRQIMWYGNRYDFKIRSYDIKTNTWTSHSNIPSGVTEEYPSYDEKHDVMLFFHENPSRMSAYHTQTDTWETFNTSGPVPSSVGRCYQRFFYNPVDNVHMLIIQENYWASTYAYRYKEGSSVAKQAVPVVLASDLSVTVSPNPFVAHVELRIADRGLRNLSGMKIYTIDGKLLKNFQSEIHSPKSAITWRPEGVPPGVYLLKVTAGSQTVTKRLFLQK
jgi:hypothetical protein